MNLDLRGKVIAATFAISLVITPLGVLGFKSWQAHAATLSTAALTQPSEGPDAAQAETLAAVTDSDTAAVQVEESSVDGGASSTPQPLWHSYQVVEGDTISDIASRFGLSVDTLMGSNGLDEDALLAIGQELVIPTADGIIHETTDGDSFWYLATLYQVSLQSIIDANPEVNPDTLAPQTKLFIPGAKPVRVRQEPVSRGGESAAAETKSSSNSGGGVFSVWPTSGSITSYYGWREDPVYGGRQFHKGIDIGAPTGEPVVAVGSGRVVMAGSYSGYGLTVMIDHQNGLVTRYSHLSRISVTEGQRVSAGQIVGAVGSTGKSTGPHLDFGVSVGGETANPLNYLP